MAIGMDDEKVFLKPQASRKKFNVDMTKSIVPQVGLLGADYDEWVHQPITSKESPRFFDNDLLELGTRTKWWMIPLIWGPIVMWTQLKALADGLPRRLLLPNVIFGLLVWTFAEYMLHRFVFHMKASSYWTNTVHYIIHGFHHKHPMDADRLVFPPLFSMVIAIPFWFLLRFVLPPKMHPAVFGGVVLGYVFYDLTHYFLHFGTAFTDRLYTMKKYHSNHHFKSQMHKHGFGVTSAFWDRVFGTLPPTKSRSTGGRLSLDDKTVTAYNIKTN